MKRTLFLFGLCLLMTVGCNLTDKAGQQVDKATADSTTTSQAAELKSGEDTPDEEADMEAQEAESAQFCKDISIGKFIAFMKSIDAANAEKIGLKKIYEVEVEDEEEPGLTYYRAIYGHDVEKGAKREFGYKLNATSDHACYFQEDSDTSIYYSMNFADESDAKDFYDRLMQYGVLVFDGDYIITEETLPAGKPTHVESIDDYHPICFFKPPQKEGEFYSIKLFPYE